MKLSFHAHCAKGHDRVEFTDRSQFDQHMKGEHKARVPGKPSWISQKPHPWVAQKPLTEAQLAKKLASWVVAGQLDMTPLFELDAAA